MKRRSLAVRMLVLLSLLALTAACGGGGGGGGSTALATGTFTKANATVSTGTTGLFDTSAYTHWQQLYLATDIKGSGKITQLAYKYPSTVSTVNTCASTTIKIGHTTLAALTTTFANNVSNGKGGQTTVLANGTLTFPADAAGTWHTITLATPFDYNGMDNLVVEFEKSAACSGPDYVDADASAAYNATAWTRTPAAATGSVGAFLVNTKFIFAGGDNAVGYNGGSPAPTPFATLWRTQMLYLASEITGTGPITGIALQSNATTTTASYTYTLKLGHTTVSALTGTFAGNFNVGTPSTIVSSGSFTIPGGVPAGEYIWIPFPGTFIYNGRDNLIVDMDVSSATASNSVNYASVGADLRTAWGTTGSATANLGLNTAALNIKFRFNGGPVTAGLGGTSSSGQVFQGDGNGAEIQSLYHASELGTGGSIASISLRLLGNSVAATHSNYTVKIGHTAKTTLIIADTYASNMDENLTVHSGSFSIPAGLKAGDWVTIPLSSAFTYNPTKNLAVLFSTAGGAGVNNSVRWKNTAGQYPGRVVGAESGGNANPAWPDNGILEIKFNLQ